MKLKSILTALLLIASMQTMWAQKVVLHMSDNQKFECNVSKLDSITFVDAVADDSDIHEYVDLGLPSGTLWATCNVGASKPEEYGDYFAWGETEPKTTYNWSTYKYCNGSGTTMTKYCTDSYYGTVDNKTELEPSDDAATVNWGSNWQMPSYEQCKELLNTSYATAKWTTQNDVYGVRITSKSNGNSIFLPAAGYYNNTGLNYVCSSGLFWSRSHYVGIRVDAYQVYFNANRIDTGDGGRDCGLNVRPVRVKDVQTVAVSSIALNQTELFVNVEETAQLSATVLPENATNKKVVWESSNKAIATVDETGKVTAVAVGTCTITCSATDGSGVKAECQVDVVMNETHEYVDLGLPSGTLWATCNVGASKPEEYGDYFAWGETQPEIYNNYSLSGYRYYDSVYKVYTKYCLQSDYGTIDNKSELEMSDDAATVNWGVDWQMPSLEQFNELINSSYTTIRWMTFNNGVNGIMIYSNSNGNYIFLPAAGYRCERSFYNAGGGGYYWSRSLNTSNSDSAYYLRSNSIRIDTSNGSRYNGFSVRPVRVKK